MKRTACLLAAFLASAPTCAQTRNPLDALRLEDLTATRERPLFRLNRRPPPALPVAPAPEPPPVEEQTASKQPPPFDLVGAVVGPGAAIALLRNKSTGQVVRMRMGDEAEGWRVATIGSRSVSLERDARREFLALATPPTVAGAPQVAGEDPGQSDPAKGPDQPPATIVGVKPPFVGMRPQEP